MSDPIEPQMSLTDWVATVNRTTAHLLSAAIITVETWPDEKVVVAWPDGSYQVARLGSLHEPPWKRGSGSGAEPK